MITFFNILQLYGIDTEKIKLVRHANVEIPILETFQNDRERFEAYQSFQKFNKFSSSNHIAVFAPDKKTTALFLGLWDIKEHLENKNLTKKNHSLIDKYSFPQKWHKKSAWYSLKLNPTTNDLTERLVVEWGGATVAWVQSKDKSVVEIKGESSIGNFQSYDMVQLKFSDLKKMVKNQASNITWVTALSSVNGIYLIRDKSNGKLYVGSAYGEKGILGRWISYANSGHGGNTELKPLDSKNFEFSILEILPPILSADEVIQRENRWKEKLGTKEYGLNLN